MNSRLLNIVTGASDFCILPSEYKDVLAAERSRILMVEQQRERNEESEHARRKSELIYNRDSLMRPNMPNSIRSYKEHLWLKAKEWAPCLGYGILGLTVFTLFWDFNCAICSGCVDDSFENAYLSDALVRLPWNRWAYNLTNQDNFFVSILAVALMYLLIALFVFGIMACISLISHSSKMQNYDREYQRYQAELSEYEEEYAYRDDMVDAEERDYQSRKERSKQAFLEELRIFDKESDECEAFYKRKYTEVRAAQKSIFTSKLAHQELGVCEWMSSEMIRILEIFKTEMERNAFARRANYRFEITITDNVYMTITGTYGICGARVVEYNYFSTNENVVPGNKQYTKWGYCATVISIVSGNVKQWLQSYRLPGGLAVEYNNRGLDSAQFTFVYDTNYCGTGIKRIEGD